MITTRRSISAASSANRAACLPAGVLVQWIQPRVVPGLVPVMAPTVAAESPTSSLMRAASPGGWSFVTSLTVSLTGTSSVQRRRARMIASPQPTGGWVSSLGRTLEPPVVQAWPCAVELASAVSSVFGWLFTVLGTVSSNEWPWPTIRDAVSLVHRNVRPWRWSEDWDREGGHDRK